MDSLFDMTLAQDQTSETPNAVVPRATVRDMVKRRQKALEAFAQLHTAMAAATSAFDLASAAHAAIDQRGREDSYMDLTREEERHFLKRIDVPKVADFLATARKIVDRRMWSVLVELTNLEDLMDKEAKDQLRQSLMTEVPEATEENIFATLEQFLADAGTIWRRGIANCFSKLDRRFRSHDGWKIGGRIIITRMFDDSGHLSYSSNSGDTMYDVDRTFHILDGAGTPTAHTGIIQRIRHERGHHYRKRQSEHDTEYFKVRCYENGNAHMWLKRKDLVEKVNKLLGEYYGAPIPEEREAKDDPLATPKTSLAKNYGFYPTPEGATRDLIDAASLYRPDDEPRLRVLEPSAGTGNLAFEILKKGARVDCIEVHPERAVQLASDRRCQGGISVLRADFLSVAPDPVYDRIVMNPPFDRERDIDHVTHALKFLKPDGLLVAIMSAGTEFRETRKSIAFRELVLDKLKGRLRDLPAGSFASVGTYCNTVILKVWADGRSQSWW